MNVKAAALMAGALAIVLVLAHLPRARYRRTVRRRLEIVQSEWPDSRLIHVGTGREPWR